MEPVFKSKEWKLALHERTLNGSQPFAMNWIPPANPLELLHNNQKKKLRHTRLQRCNNAETLPVQEPRIFPRHPAGSVWHLGCFVTKATKSLTHMWTHKFRQTQKKKKEDATPTTRHKHFRAHGHMRPRWRRAESLVCTTGWKHPYLLRRDAREHALPRRNSRG